MNDGKIQLNETKYTFVTAWYGVCGGTACEPFDLKSLPDGALFKVIQISESGTSRVSFNPNLPSVVPQPFSTLECGFLYELTFNPMNIEVTIPGLVGKKKSTGSDSRLAIDCDQIGTLSTKEISQNETKYTFVTGWYGVCSDVDCESFDLKSLPDGALFKAIQIAESGTSRVSFNPNLPSVVPQPFSTLECGFMYELTLNPGTNKLNIPGFIWNKQNGSDEGRISVDGCIVLQATPTPTPQPLPVVEISDATDNTITVAWTLLGQNQEKVKAEIATEQNGASNIDTIELSSDVTEYTFSNLTSKSQYYIRVATINEVTDELGAWVELSSSTTIPGNFGTIQTHITDANKPRLTYIPGTGAVTWEYVNILKQISGSYVKISDISYDASTPFTFEFIDDSVDTDGTYLYKIQFNNGFNGSFSDIVSVTVDTTPAGVPNPQTQTPTNNPRPTWIWPAISGAVRYHVTLNSQNSNFTGVANSDVSYESTQDLSDGEHTIEVMSEDSSGNLSEVGSHTVRIDTTPPIVPNPETTLSITNNPRPTWNWRKTADIAEFGIIFDGGTEIITQNNSYTPTSSLPDGSYEIKVKAKDEVGNWSEYGTNTVVVDITSPAIPQPTTTTPTSNAQPKWTWPSVPDAVEYGVILGEESEVWIADSEYSSPIVLDNGLHTIQVRSKDEVGNISEPGTHIVEVDKIAPVAPSPSTSTPTNNVRPTWTWAAVQGANEYHVSLNGSASVSVGTDKTFTPIEDLTSGDHTIQVWATDAVGNQSEKGSHTVTIDLELPPVPQPTTTTPTNNTQPTWTWNALPDVTEYIVTINNNQPVTVTTNSYQSPTELPEGSNTIKVKSKDSVGNLSNDSGVHTVVIDTTAPAVPSPTTTTPTSNPRPIWTWAESDEDFEYGIVLDNKPEVVQTLNAYNSSVDLTDGEHELKVRAKDEVGNWSAYGTHNVRIDTPPPSDPSISAPDKTRDRTPTFTWTSEGSPSEYGVTFNNQAEVVQTAESYSVESNLDDGTYNLKVRAKDSVGNWSDQSSHNIEIYCIPDTHQTYVNNAFGITFDVGTGKSLTFLGPKNGEGLGVNVDEWTSGPFANIDVHLEGTYYGSLMPSGFVPPSNPTKLYLQIGHDCYEADLGDGQRTETQHTINFTKITI